MTKTTDERIESITKIYEDRIMKLEQSLEVMKIEEKKKAELRELERKLAKESNPVYDNQKNMMFIMFMAIILLLLIFAFGFFV